MEINDFWGLSRVLLIWWNISDVPLHQALDFSLVPRGRTNGQWLIHGKIPHYYYAVGTDSCTIIDGLISTTNRTFLSEVPNFYTLLTDSFDKPSLHSSQEECAATTNVYVVVKSTLCFLYRMRSAVVRSCHARTRSIRSVPLP